MTPTPKQMAETMKSEILRDIATGIVPDSVSSFSELHNYVDANLYGNAESVLAELSELHQEAQTALDSHVAIANAAMEIVDNWLQNHRAE